MFAFSVSEIIPYVGEETERQKKLKEASFFRFDCNPSSLKEGWFGASLQRPKQKGFPTGDGWSEDGSGGHRDKIHP